MEPAELLHLSIWLEGEWGAYPRADDDSFRRSHFGGERGCSCNCP